ncbi:unnamed protein product [Paramecium sonneborni]|uniref:Uncharacterized protein n=1 Tax=Paramecium sonneborni TaxID=65129 RepID=A0A8S1R716_9CILI|nr:unnamed protein product [Paramecium sonneborni]
MLQNSLNTCRDSDCFDISSLTSSISCDLGNPRKTCIYIQGTFYNRTDGFYKVPDNKAFCDLLTLNNINCSYIVGEFCTPNYKNLKIMMLQMLMKKKLHVILQQIKLMENEFMFGGYKCVTLETCHSYDGSATAKLGQHNGKEITQCRPIFKAIATRYPCIKHASDPRKCETQVLILMAVKMVARIMSVIVYSIKINVSQKLHLHYILSKIMWVMRMKNNFGVEKLLIQMTTNAIMIVLNALIGFVVTQQLPDFIQILITKAFREQMLDNSGNDYYKSNTAVVTYGNCQVRTFYDNVFAKSDGYCNIWMKDCVTRENVVYRKIDLVLNIEVQKLNVKHSNSIHIMKMPTKLMYIYYVLECHPIRRIVSVKIESAQTIQLQLQMMNAKPYLDGCVTKGIGCVSKFFNCSAYQGTRDTCSNFKESSGYNYCYNVENATKTSNCQKQNCSNIQGTNNKNCNNEMKPFNTPFCVLIKLFVILMVRDARCSKEQKSLSQLIQHQMVHTKLLLMELLQEGVPKEVARLSSRLCDYWIWCTFAVNSNSMINQDSCKLRPECTWVNQYQPTKVSCYEQSGTSRSTCVNTVITMEIDNVKIKKYYAWTEIGNQCRDQKCEDQSATINSHKQCNDFDKSCTSAEICFWKGSNCKLKECSDLIGTTYDRCSPLIKEQMELVSSLFLQVKILEINLIDSSYVKLLIKELIFWFAVESYLEKYVFLILKIVFQSSLFNIQNFRSMQWRRIRRNKSSLIYIFAQFCHRFIQWNLQRMHIILGFGWQDFQNFAKKCNYQAIIKIGDNIEKQKSLYHIGRQESTYYFKKQTSYQIKNQPGELVDLFSRLFTYLEGLYQMQILTCRS